MTDFTVESYGPSAVLIRFARQVDEQALARSRGILKRLADLNLTGLTDIVPAYGEILLEFDFPIEKDYSPTRRLLEDELEKAEPLPAEAARLHDIPVCYDGPDLEDLARGKGLSIEDVIRLHSEPTYDVYQIGFSPGFPYLGPLNPLLHAPRLASPRTVVPKGSVAIGGEHTGVYSIASPGGWRLIGRTDAPLFSAEKSREAGTENAFLLRQGDRVKFLPTA